MPPDKTDYHIAWILSSSDQQEIADEQFEQTFDFYSSTLHVTYRFGRVGQHNVVLASPASRDDKHSSDLIVDDLLQNAPSVRAGFFVSSDAVAPRRGPACVGDIVVGVSLSHLEQNVTHFNAEETIRQRRLCLTGRVIRVPDVVTRAVWRLSTYEGRDETQQTFHESSLLVDEIRDSASRNAAHSQSRAFYGVIASSTRHMDDAGLVKMMATQNKVMCFETGAATIKSSSIMVVAGIVNYWGHAPSRSSYGESCKAPIVYLTNLLHQIDPRQLELIPPIKDYFEYESFDLETPGCRLLRLPKGTGELECHLFQAYLPSNKNTSKGQADDDTLLIPYEALSYCWGSTAMTHRVRVNGKVHFITEKLFEALHHLRLVDTDRILWIDAICIDQSNVLERGHQVNLMGQLYSHADQVLIWLGSVGRGVDDLISTLKAFEASVPREAWKQWFSEDIRFQEIWNEVQNSSEDTESVQASLRKDLELLMGSAWFSRVWIIQEVAKAKRASLGCTDGWIHARTFAIAPHLLHVTPGTQCQAIIDIMPGPSKRFSRFSQKPKLSTLLWRFRQSQASDPRDRLYALLGISADDPIATDYTKTEEDIVKDVMEYWFQGKMLPISHVSSVAELQREIPYIFSSVLDQLIVQGADMNDVESFTSRHTRPIFLSEQTINYLRYIRSPLQKHFTQQARLIQVTPNIRQSEATCSLLHLEEFLSRNERARITETTIDRSHQNGFSFASMVLEQSRQDIEINDVLVKGAARIGPDALEQLHLTYDGAYDVTRKVIDDMVQHTDRIQRVIRDDPDILEALFKHCADRAKFAQALVSEAARIRSDNLEALLEDLGDEVEISDAAIRVLFRNHSKLGNFLAKCNHWCDFDVEADRKGGALEAPGEGSHLRRAIMERYGSKLRMVQELHRQVVKKLFAGVIRCDRLWQMVAVESKYLYISKRCLFVGHSKIRIEDVD